MHKSIRCACIVGAMLAAGCANEMPFGGMADAPPPQKDAKRIAGAASPAVIPFNDIQTFDKELSRSLQDNPDKVTVVVEDRVPLKEMPPRVDKWLAAVDNGGGKVNVKSDVPEPKGQEPKAGTRGLPLIGAAISAFQMFREHARESQYDPAKGYDATVYYKRDASGDRVVDRIEMIRRK